MHWLLKASVAALLAGNAADTATSWGHYETNSTLAGSDGRFGARAVGIKIGVTGALLVGEYFIVRKHPEREKFFAIANFAVGAELSRQAIKNYEVTHYVRGY